MPKATRKIVVSPKAAKANKPGKAAPAADTKAAALPAVSPVTAAPIAPTVETTAAPAVAKPAAHINRTAATIAKQATNYAVFSDRDSAYLAFYAKLAKRSASGTVTLADIVASGERPQYAGSNKPHDAGVIVRLTKAGMLQPGSDGHGFAFTATGKTHKAYTSAQA